ncbi:MAG TPA: hypothetical protein VHS03_06060 [Gaiellaceae bacterium]|jgi:hypothetical protein|nr:hypothetical protein [Gaiellaceae bacterium]
MKLTRTSLAGVAVVAVLAACGIAAAAAAATTTPSTTVRLYAKAGPVKMHATLNVTLAPVTGAQALAALGQLSSCTVQHTSNPRNGVADKLVCTTASGKQVVVPASMAAATLTYKLNSSMGLSSTQGMTVQIRHGSSVIETLAPGTATISLPTGHTAAMVSGRDTLYVIAGAHTYHGKITVVK